MVGLMGDIGLWSPSRVPAGSRAAATITLGLNTGAAIAAAEHFLSALSIPPNATYDWSGFQALDASETIRALQGTASALTVVISGVEL
mgnify:CR=1 FL=1